MKTKLFLFLTTFVTMVANAQCSGNVNIPDSKFRTVILNDTNINTDGNSQISCAEATAYSGRILVYNKSVNDLTGIEAFINITNLDVRLNNLTSIDISKNIALTSLNFSNNSLTSIDASKNTALTFLSGSYNNLTSLDVSKNISLDNLNLVGNNLTSLDVSNNTSLTFLTLNYNDISILDVSKNTALVYLSCNNTDLTSLDVSANTVLAQLNCKRSDLSSLNIANGNNSNISTGAFTATSNPNLTCIQVDDVSYATTNFTNIDAQTSFSTNCIPCNVSIPDANFKEALVANTSINTDSNTEISCVEAVAFTGAMNVNNKGINDLTGIEMFTNLTELFCRQNNLSNIDVSNNTALIGLAVSQNPITILDVSNNSNLTNLVCSANNSLTTLNLANGNNAALVNFDAISSLNLTCIQIDSGFTPPASWQKETTASYSTNCAALSVDTFSLNSVSIYPNPVNSVLNIKMNSNLKRATIYSLLGTKILETTSKKIKTSNLKRGIYLIKIKDQNGSISTKRFMKE